MIEVFICSKERKVDFMLTLFHARVSFAPKQSVASNGTPYVLLNVSQRGGGKDAEGKAVFNEFHVTVWDSRDIELARSLSEGDRITISLERLRLGYRTDKNGKVIPYMTGNAVAGEIVAEYTNKPSAGLFQYETAAETRREQYRQAKTQKQAPQPQAPQPAQVQAVPQPQAPQAPQPAQVQTVPLPQTPQPQAQPVQVPQEMAYEVPF